MIRWLPVVFLLLAAAPAGTQPQPVAQPAAELPTVRIIATGGTIAGVQDAPGTLGAYLVLYPRARVWVLVPFLIFLPLRLPAWLVLGFWFVLQLFDGLGSLGAMGAATTGGVAFFAHIGGFVFGAAIALLYRTLAGGGRRGRTVG